MADPPRLVLGPLLRHAGSHDATIWVETDRPCTVEVLGTSARTFCVAGHHYGLLCLEGLEAGCSIPYEVALDGHSVWPEAGDPYPPCAIRTPSAGERLTVAFGSCRVTVPHAPPYALTKDEDDRGREVDALLALVERLRAQPADEWPDVLLLLGDQVYADEVSPGTRERIEARRGGREPRDGDAPLEEIADFEEYTWLYQEAWSDPAMRWLLSTIPSAMVFDDHDVHDDWNISQAWEEEVSRLPWWEDRILGAYMSYWLYQHLGNLTPAELAEDRLLAELRELDDGAQRLREFARHAQQEVAGTRWSYRRDFGRTRLVVIDSRAGRILEEGRRDMLSEEQWSWIEESVSGDFDHLLIGTTLPWLLSPGLHHLEAWNEAVCGGAWGRRAARVAEKLRQGVDLEHWAAFGRSFARLTDLIREVASGGRGTPPASVIVLSGDVHHAYLAEAAFPGDGVRSAVVQVVCSPVRNPLDARERRTLRLALTTPARGIGRALARSAGVPPARVRWEFVQKPTFDNQVGLLDLDGRRAHVRIEKTVPEEWRAPRLHASLARSIAD
ncbi:MAG: alkaline phosphatase D family protein [Solirubrobacterales bacterium]|nr:alkaline phosphatase D family protein [Solirubrobacterales bacterium]